MNAQVCLLVLVTAAFMAIWDADRPGGKVAASEIATIEAVIPLPTNLQTGTWHLTRRDGETFRITVERHGSSSGCMSTEAWRSDDQRKEICVRNPPDGTHWNFIAEPSTNRSTARHSSHASKELKSMGFHH